MCGACGSTPIVRPAGTHTPGELFPILSAVFIHILNPRVPPRNNYINCFLPLKFSPSPRSLFLLNLLSHSQTNLRFSYTYCSKIFCYNLTFNHGSPFPQLEPRGERVSIVDYRWTLCHGYYRQWFVNSFSTALWASSALFMLQCSSADHVSPL